ncbi:Crp/Fnr family transcriptional regulator [Sphingomonas sp. LB3N6]|uniref:Crp/Fnr family transcriptional regulator n=1 Tax=Sphingomonas fucosidasi TaxID=3096164 RepID=UPI003FA7B783
MARSLSVFTHRLSETFPLSASDQEALLSLDVTRRDVLAGSYIIREGDLAYTCSILISGIAIRQKVTAIGHQQIVALVIPGDALDLPNVFLRTADHDVRALTDIKIATVSAVRLRNIFTISPSIAQAVLLSVLTDNSICREWILNLGQRDAKTRLAHFICEHAARMDERGLSTGDVINIPMTQKQLGHATGLTSVHVNRMLKMLEADGLIVKVGRQLLIPSIAKLRNHVDFNARYLHLPGSE